MTLPSGWTKSPIGDLCGLINGKAFKPSDWAKAGLPIIRIQNLNRTDADFNFCNTAVDERFIVEPGELLFAWSGTPGTSFGAHVWQGPRAVLNQHIFRVQFDETAVDRDYFKRAINSTLEELIVKAHGGVGLAHVTKGKFEATEVLLPPKAEQRRIVGKLDALTAGLIRAREEIERVPVLAGRVRATVLREAFSGKFSGLDNVAYLPCEHWIGSTFYGPRFSKDDYVSEGIPTARTTDFNDDGSMSLETAPRVACSPSDFSKWGLAEGDLLVTRTGSIGKCAVYNPSDGPVLPSAYLIRVRFTPAIITRFAWMMFASPQGQEHLGVNSRAVTQPNINASAIRSLPFPLLTPDQQKATITAVDAAFAHADRLEAEAARARALLERLEFAILAKAFRGELVPQDPNDEPASILLERTRAKRAATPKVKRGRRVVGATAA